MEASALQARPGLTRGRASIGTSLLRLRSDEQLVELFRAGNDEAFRAIHDRYRTRLLAYVRQMLHGSSQDAEDALQDVFMKAFAGLRANDRELALRAWLYRVAHNRCVDQIRRATPPVSLEAEPLAPAICDPASAIEQREELRRLVVDVGRLPHQQRSALLMRELSGMSYAELADSLELSVPAVKSVLVRARVGLAAAAEARDTACTEIRAELVQCHDRGVKPPATARRHLRDCSGCREFRASMRAAHRQLTALAPAIGPIGALAKLLGLGGAFAGGAAAGGGGGATGVAAGGATGAAAGGAVAASAAAGTGAVATGHLAAVIAAAVVTAGGAAVAIQPVLAPSHSHHARPVAHAARTPRGDAVAAEAIRIAAIRSASKGTAAIAPAALTPTEVAAPTEVPAGAKANPKPAAAPPKPHYVLPIRATRFRMAGSPEANAPVTTGGSGLASQRAAGRPVGTGASGSTAGTSSTATTPTGTNASVVGAANTYGQGTGNPSTSTTGTGTGTGTASGSDTTAATSPTTGTAANGSTTGSATGTPAGGTTTDPAAGGTSTDPAAASATGTTVPAGSTPPATTTATPPPSLGTPPDQTPASGTAPSSAGTSSAASNQASNPAPSDSGSVTTPTGSTPTQPTGSDGGAAMGSPASSATNQVP